MGVVSFAVLLFSEISFSSETMVSLMGSWVPFSKAFISLLSTHFQEKLVLVFLESLSQVSISSLPFWIFDQTSPSLYWIGSKGILKTDSSFWIRGKDCQRRGESWVRTTVYLRSSLFARTLEWLWCMIDNVHWRKSHGETCAVQSFSAEVQRQMELCQARGRCVKGRC